MAIYSPNFEATRGADTKSLYWDRAYYKERTTQIFDNINSNYIDLWYDVPFYGKVNEFGNLVMPKISSLTYGAADNLVTLPFVRQAYEEFRFYIQRGGISGRTNLQDLFGNFEVRRSFEDSLDTYFNYAFSVLGAFNEEIIESGTFIVNPKAYMRALVNYLKKNKIIFSFYSFFASPLITPRCSGFALEIVLEDYNEDINKNLYFKNPEFQKYVRAAASFGFRVNKNAPWSLVADLNSKPMRKGRTVTRRGQEPITFDGYLQQHYIPDLDYLFENHYDKVIDMTFFLLKTTVFKAYREYQDLMQFLVTPGKTTFTPDPSFNMASTAAIHRGRPTSTTIDKYSFTDFIVKLPDCLFLRILENILRTEFKTKNNRKYHKFRKDFYILTKDYVHDLDFTLSFLEEFYDPTKVFDPKTLKPHWTIPKNRRNLLTLAPDDVMIPSEKKMPTVERIVTEYYTGF